MKTMILFRFDTLPNPEVSEILSQHMTDKGHLMQIPGAWITIFHTESELVRIDQQLKMLITRDGMTKTPLMYMLIDVTDAPCSIALPGSLNQIINKYANRDIDGGQSQESQSVAGLMKQLKVAVDVEDYEAASDLQKRIDELKKGNEKDS